jgi:ATP-dependent RNA helicase SUPV3L1/SUV3
LLKPAARALASLLWAQKQDNVDLAALSNAQHMASSGRTSFPVDKQLLRDAYRLLGYRQCGERAVRVDILERLADLIRPALAWRESSPGVKPAGAFDGRGFVVTQSMTSLTGSAGEDFASILRALGYRMDRRPPLPPKPVAAVEAVAAEAAPAVEETAAAEATPAVEIVAADAAPAMSANATMAAAQSHTPCVRRMIPGPPVLAASIAGRRVANID